MSLERLSNYVAHVEAENDLLRERIRQLEEMVGIGLEVPPMFGLTGKESALLGIMMERELTTKESALDLMYFDRPNDTPEVKIIDVFVCKMRKKLEKFDVKIETVWGRGYRLPPDSKKNVQAYLKQALTASSS